MVEILFFSFVSLLALLGLTEVFYCIKSSLKRPKEKTKVYQLIFLGTENTEQQIDYIISESLWHGKKMGEYILVIVPKGISIENRSVIEENYNIIFCDFEEVSDSLKKMGEDFYAKRD